LAQAGPSWLGWALPAGCREMRRVRPEPNNKSVSLSPGASLGTLKGSDGGTVGLASQQTFHGTARLPREGPEAGKGAVVIMDRSIFESQLQNVEEPSMDASVGLERERRPSAGANAKNRTAGGESSGRGPKASGTEAPKPATESESPRSSILGNPRREKTRLSPEERRKVEIASKWEKTESMRERDRTQIAERIAHGHELREERFKRLQRNVTGNGNLAYQMAVSLREHEAREEKARHDLYSEWHDKVYQPMATKAYEKMNPPNRVLQQMLSGTKTVSFNDPKDGAFKLVANEHQDPARKQIMDAARENAFHKAACRVLGRSHSAPDAGTLLRMRQPGSNMVPKALSKPVLEPTSWGQLKLQDTLYGHLAQACEEGPGSRRGKRGGTEVFVPDTRDGVAIAGTRKSRIHGLHDVGILRANTSTQGESSNLKSAIGASHAAPAQDHYTFEIGARVTNLEFPLGKRVFPGVP